MRILIRCGDFQWILHVKADRKCHTVQASIMMPLNTFCPLTFTIYFYIATLSCIVGQIWELFLHPGYLHVLDPWENTPPPPPPPPPTTTTLPITAPEWLLIWSASILTHKAPPIICSRRQFQILPLILK